MLVNNWFKSDTLALSKHKPLLAPNFQSLVHSKHFIYLQPRKTKCSTRLFHKVFPDCPNPCWSLSLLGASRSLHLWYLVTLCVYVLLFHLYLGAFPQGCSWIEAITIHYSVFPTDSLWTFRAKTTPFLVLYPLPVNSILWAQQWMDGWMDGWVDG